MSVCGPDLVQVAFDTANPEAVAWARERSATLITDITKSSRDAVKRVMERALRGDLSPREAAKLIRLSVGLTGAQSEAVLNLRAKLLAKGQSAAQVETATKRYAARLLRYRAETIARTETTAAANEGQRQLWKQAQENGLLRTGQLRRWVTTPDERLCPVCSKLNGKTATMDGTFPGGFLAPPAHPNCRCATVLEFGRSAA